MQITKYYSKNFNKNSRSNKSITMIIIHYTGMQSERESLRRLSNPKSKVSAHYLISRNGKIFKMIDEQKIAWHAGKSRWKNYVNLNQNSIGVELVNKGHKNGYQSFPKKQIIALINLCKKIKSKYKIKNKFILGHSDIAPLRKIDPGEKFPWRYLSSKGIGIYPKQNFEILKLKKNIDRSKFFNNLGKIGYRYLKKGSKKKLITNFQRRYRQRIINGVLDFETFKISEFLAKNKDIS